MEYRVARSAVSDKSVNVLEIRRPFSFAVLELLDDRDSKSFIKKLKAKKWKNITPSEIKKTYYWKRPAAGELDGFKGISPDWLYLSGHYGRIYANGDGGRVLTVLPGGFFNEPFHRSEWKSAWTKTDDRSFFLQGESMTPEAAKLYETYLKTRSIAPTSKFHYDDLRPLSEAAVEWRDAWRSPSAAIDIAGKTAPSQRGFLLGHIWPDVKVVLTICCNLLSWKKNAVRKSFPNALILGYLGKNPANSTPHVNAFLKNVFRDVKELGDPRLVDHDHIARAWVDVYFRQGYSKSNRMAYLTTDNDVMAISGKGVKRVGADTDVIVSYSLVKQEVFGYYKDGGTMVVEP